MKQLFPVTLFFVVTAALLLPAPGNTESARGPRLFSNAPKDASDHYYRGVTHESAGRLEEAAREYRLVLRRSPAHGDARRRLAEIHLFKGETAEAIMHLKELAYYQEHNPLVHYRLGQLYESSGNIRKATAAYRKAIDSFPGNLSARRGLARLYARRKMPNEAATEYRAILAVAPDDIPSRNALTAIYLRGKKYDQLTDLLKEAAERKPDDPATRFKLGLVYEFRKKYAEAAGEYEKAVELDKGYAKAMNALARVYMKTGDTGKAKEMMEAAVKADPSLKGSAIMPRNLGYEFRHGDAVKKKSYKKRARKKKSYKKNVRKKSYSKSRIKKKGKAGISRKVKKGGKKKYDKRRKTRRATKTKRR